MMATKTDYCDRKKLFSVFQLSLDEKELPMLLAGFGETQRDFHARKIKEVKMLWQEMLISNVQEILASFQFYVTNLAEYVDKEI